MQSKSSRLTWLQGRALHSAWGRCRKSRRQLPSITSCPAIRTQNASLSKGLPAIGPSLTPAAVKPPATDPENVKLLSSTAAIFSAVAENSLGPGAEAARRLSRLLLQLAASEPRLRKKFETVLVEPLRIALDELREALRAR